MILVYPRCHLLQIIALFGPEAVNVEAACEFFEEAGRVTVLFDALNKDMMVIDFERKRRVWIKIDIIHAVEEPSFDGVVTRKPLAEGIALRPHPDDAKVLNLHDPQ